jgi:hypothetical protein
VTLGGFARTLMRIVMIKWVVIWGVVAVGSAIVGGILAGYKRRDHSFWAAWSFIFPPMVLVLLATPKNHGTKSRRRTLDEEDAANAD